MTNSTDQNASRSCSNCGHALPSGGEYCPHCGQKYTTGRVTVGQLFSEFFEAVFNFDSKIFLTLRDLPVPGKLTEQFFLGRRQRYIPPIRLLFLSIIIHLATISWLAEEQLASLFQQSNRELQEAAYQQVAEERLDSLRRQLSGTLEASPAARQALDTLYEALADDQLPDSLNALPYLRFEGFLPLEATILKVAYKDLETLSTDSLLDKYSVSDWKSRLVLTQSVKLLHESTSFTRFLLGQMTWMILLMMPALALLLKVLYIRCDFYYIEHLVFSFHYHAFAFLIMSVALILDEIWEMSLSLTGIAFLGVLVYLFLAMRRVYRQGFFKTFLKFVLLNNGYLLLLLTFLVVTLLVSALLY